MPFVIDPATTIGTVTLSVAALDRSLHYYQRDLGLALLHQDGNQATLGVGSVPLVRLQEVAGARLVRRATGLYHFALRVPTRQDLARVLRHFAAHGTRISGVADHRVSEAVYLSDPDGHGIEVYRDRPHDVWRDTEGTLHAVSAPLDLSSILRELDTDEAGWQGLPSGTTMGHIHLQVADIRAAQHFYVDVLGFERMMRMPGASFVAAGGYHHHVGLNTWAGIGVPAPPERAARLVRYEVILPNEPALHAVLARLRAHSIGLEEDGTGWAVSDPAHNRLVLRHAATEAQSIGLNRITSEEAHP